jgi:hypothetical protein
MSSDLKRVQTVLGLIFFAGVVVGAVFAYIYLGWIGVVAVGVLVGYALLEGIATELPGWLKRAKLKRRQRQGQCVHCGYDLRGNPQTTVCSECGKSTADAKTT